MSCKSCIRTPCPFPGSDGSVYDRYNRYRRGGCGGGGCGGCGDYGYVGPYNDHGCGCNRRYDRAYDDVMCAYKLDCKKKCKTKVYVKKCKCKKSKCGC